MNQLSKETTDKYMGMKFGKLTILEKSETVSYSNKKYKCLCDCGNITNSQLNNLKTGKATSCGCGRGNGIKSYTNCTKMPEYNTWVHMKSRCYNENDSFYHRYGGRGITVCDRWIDSFNYFLDDMGKRPSSKHSLDRIDNDGNYEPSNCRWTTFKIQARNRSNNTFIETHWGKITMAEFSEITKLKMAWIMTKFKIGFDFTVIKEPNPNTSIYRKRNINKTIPNI
jgi:hypothetical protein